MRKAEREELDRKVLALFKAKGTLCPNQVKRHFQIKWETAQKSIMRLVKNGDLFYHPEMGDSPSFYSIWSDHASPRYFTDGQQSKNGTKNRDSTTTTFVKPYSEGGIVRGTPGETIEKEGFLCHPSMKGKDVPRTFVRGHLHGQYYVKVKQAGSMPETYVVPGTEITGGWTVRKMNGNDCYFGHLKMPDDRMAFKFHLMTDKDGKFNGMSVYVHPRYFYYKNNPQTASVEFRQQVIDVITVLSNYGWVFGEIVQKGNYSMALNDPVLASHVKSDHIESETDEVLFDSSVGSADGVCTEAEVIYRQPSDAETNALLVELPSRFIGLEDRVDALGRSVNGMVRVLESTIPHMDNLTRTVGNLVEVTEFNSSVIFGTAHPLGTDQSYVGKDNKEDRMYG